MRRRASELFAFLVVCAGSTAAGCGKGGTTPGGGTAEPPGSGSAHAAPATPPSVPGAACEQLPFTESTPVPEASGAAWLPIDGKPMLVVIGDSGNHGAYGIVDPETGATVETGQLPMADTAGDDLEGVAVRGGKLYGVISAGWVRVWQRTGKAFSLVEPPYALGPVDLPNDKNNDRAPKGDGMVCNPRVVNCGRNYEGLCLVPDGSPAAAAAAVPGACVGFAASKADGHLYCLTDEAGKLVVHHERSIAITRPGALADCAFADDGTLWVGNNLFDLGRIYRVSHWDDPPHAQVDLVGPVTVGFPETIAARGDVVYRMSDMGGAPSLMARFRCPR